MLYVVEPKTWYTLLYDISRTLVGNKIIDHGFYGLSNDNCKTRREAFKFWDLVRLMLEVWR